MYTLDNATKYFIRFQVDKFHVEATNREILRELHDRISHVHPSREYYRAFYSYAIRRAKHNRKTYAYINLGWMDALPVWSD